MLSSSHLISSANRARSDIDQVIQSLSSEQNSSDSVRSRDEDVPDIQDDSVKSSNNCAVERYHDLDGCQQKSAFHPYPCGEITETYTQQLQFDDKSYDGEEDTPISSIWETRWFDHAALVGRFMAEDKIHSDQSSSDAQQYIPVPEQPHDTEDTPTSPPERVITPKPAREKTSPVTKSVKSSSNPASLFKCKFQECQAVFSTQSQRWYHQKAAHTQIQLQCPECHKIFVKLQQLEVHLRSHLKLKMYKCPEEGCEKSFLTQQQRKNHILIHTGEKNFECTVCNKKFREKSTLKRHSRTHSQIKVYRCEDCHKSFSYASSLRVHRKHFHSKSIVESTVTSGCKKSKRTQEAQKSKETQNTAVKNKDKSVAELESTVCSESGKSVETDH